MNGYPSYSHLYELDRETLWLVVQYDPFYRAYVDVLALIHDLLCEFTESQEKPRFTLAEIDEQKNRVVTTLYSREINHDQEMLMKNIEENYRLAWEIRHNVQSSETPDERFQAELKATQFLNSLIQTYTTLRILKRNREPAQP